MVGFIPLLVLFCYEILMMSVLFGYEISVAAGFVQLCDLNDGKFFSFTRLQRQSDLFFLRDFNDGWFCSVKRSQ